MKTLTITANNETVTNKADNFLVDGNLIYVKNMYNEFATPFATDDAYVSISDRSNKKTQIIKSKRDGYVCANPVKWKLVDDRKHDFDEVYEIIIE